MDPFLDASLIRATRIRKMRKLMSYGEAEFRKDWEQSVAMAVLLERGAHHSMKRLLESCFDRMEAYMANNPDALPFEWHKANEGAEILRLMDKINAANNKRVFGKVGA